MDGFIKFLIKIDGKIIIRDLEGGNEVSISPKGVKLPLSRSEAAMIYDMTLPILERAGINLKHDESFQKLNILSLKKLKEIAEDVLQDLRGIAERNFDREVLKLLENGRVEIDEKLEQVLIAFPLNEAESLDREKCYADLQKERLNLTGYFIPVKLTMLWNGVEIYSGHDSVHNPHLAKLLVEKLIYELRVVRDIYCRISRIGVSLQERRWMEETRMRSST